MSPKAGSTAPRRTAGIAPLVAVAVLVSALVVGTAVWWRPVLYASGLWVDGGRPTIPADYFETPPPGAPASPSPAPRASADPAAGSGVVGPAQPAPSGTAVDRAALARALAAVPAKGAGSTSGVVLDASSGQPLWQQRPTATQIPASTLKLLTCLAALDVLGPDATFTTRVVQPSPGRIVLVGGGDPYLRSVPGKDYPASADTRSLARATAARLTAAGATSVVLGHDDALFSGPGWHPSWPQGYHDQVSTIGALWVDKGRPAPDAAPSPTPGLAAAQLFARQLQQAGIRATVEPRATRAPATATQLAAVRSLPVSTLVQETLVHSDNDAAEVLLRQVGIATGHGGSFAGGTRGVQDRLAALGAWQPGMRLADGSGLSRDNRVTAQALGRVLHLAATRPTLRPLLEGLPSAGVSGTLHARFANPTAAPGRGWVNAKTGTLSKVSTLAGYTRTRSGEEVVFAFLSNNPQQEWDVRAWLDQMGATLAACGC